MNSIAFSQFEKTESAPPRIKWLQKKSPNFKIYFPKELDSIANYTMSFLENNIDKLKIKPQDKIRRSKIILHNQNSIPNAFVSSGPRRSELYINAKTESPHFLHNNNWVDLLAAHEYRHLVQREVGHNNLFNRLVHYLFGEKLSSILGRSTAPMWYWEGDAVYTETNIGNYGRGRIPKFTLTTQTNLAANDKIKYDRQTLGSFKVKTPNEYETGYLMVKYINEKYGSDKYNNVVAKANSQSYLPMPFYRALKKETKQKYKELYEGSLTLLPQKDIYTNREPLNIRKGNLFSSFIYPTLTNDGDIIVIKQGYGSYKDFRIISKEGEESLLFTPGIINDFGRIPYSKDMIAWLEFDKDPRWDKRVYSSVKLLNIKTKKLINKKVRGFFSSVDLSPDGKDFVVMANNKNGSQSFLIYNIETLNLKKEYILNSGVYSSLKYSNNTELIGIKTERGTKNIFTFNLNTERKKIIYTTKKNIGWPSHKHNQLIFSRDLNGFEELFVYDIKSKELFILNGHKLGSYYPFISGKNIFYSSMGNSGFNIYKSELNKENLLLVDKEKPTVNNPNQNITTKHFKTQKTNRFIEAFSPVSWGISDYGFSDKGLDYITLGLDSRSLFGDLLFSGGYKFDVRDNLNSRYFGLSYQGFFPIIDFSITSSNDSFTQDLILKNQDNYDTINNADINFKIREFSTNIKVPLSYTKGKYFSSFLGSFGYSYEKFKDFYTTSIGSESIKFPLIPSRDKRTYVSSLLLYSRKHKKSKRQVHSPFEQTILIEGKKTLGDSDYSGAYFRSDVYLGFPGFRNTHSTRIKLRGESQTKGDYLFRKNINFISGYQNLFNFSEFIGWGIEYELPLLYPDLAIGPIAYIQRIRGLGFVNNGIVSGYKTNGSGINETPTSVGVGLVLDLNLFRQAFLFEFGVKYSYVIGVSQESNGNKFEISLGSITF